MLLELIPILPNASAWHSNSLVSSPAAAWCIPRSAGRRLCHLNKDLFGPRHKVQVCVVWNQSCCTLHSLGRCSMCNQARLPTTQPRDRRSPSAEVGSGAVSLHHLPEEDLQHLCAACHCRVAEQIVVVRRAMRFPCDELQPSATAARHAAAYRRRGRSHPKSRLGPTAAAVATRQAAE